MLAICFEHVLLFENDETVNEKKRIYKSIDIKEKKRKIGHTHQMKKGVKKIYRTSIWMKRNGMGD